MWRLLLGTLFRRLLPVLLKTGRSEVVSFFQSALHHSFELVEVRLRSRAPLVDNNRRESTQGEEGHLLHGLIISREVLGGHHIPVDQCLEGVHPIENDHSFTLVEDTKV